MNQHVERSVLTLLEHSECQTSWQEAKKEWRYTGECYDAENTEEDCELCGYEGIRYHFLIRNLLNDNRLDVGSECIKKFRVVGRFNGRDLTEVETERRLAEDLKEAKEDARIVRVSKVVRLVAAGEGWDQKLVTSMLDAARNTMTPKQAAWLIGMARKHRIEHDSRDYRVQLRRHRDQDALRALQPYQFQAIWPCLSTQQKSEYRYLHKVKLGVMP